MDLVVLVDHTPVREVISRVLARVLGRPRRGVHRPARPAGPSAGLRRLDGHRPGRPAPAVPDMPAVAAPPLPSRPPAGAHRPPPPLTPAPGEGLDDVAQALAAAHDIVAGTASGVDIWSCRACAAAGFGVDLDAARDHLLVARTRGTNGAGGAR